MVVARCFFSNALALMSRSTFRTQYLGHAALYDAVTSFRARVWCFPRRHTRQFPAFLEPEAIALPNGWRLCNRREGPRGLEFLHYSSTENVRICGLNRKVKHGRTRVHNPIPPFCLGCSMESTTPDRAQEKSGGRHHGRGGCLGERRQNPGTIDTNDAEATPRALPAAAPNLRVLFIEIAMPISMTMSMPPPAGLFDCCGQLMSAC